MKNIFSEDPETIEKEIDSLVESKTELICGRRGAEKIKKFAVVGKTTIKERQAFILLHPDEPTCSSGTCLFYYHSKGQPLRVFECKRIKKAENFVGFEFPTQIFNIYQRRSGRVTTPSTSVVTFCVKNKQRIHYGTIGDISLEGAKLFVDVPGELASGTGLCHIALTVRYRLSEIQTVLTVPEAEIVWSHCEQERTKIVGIRFTLSQDDHNSLSSYIDIRSIEAAYKPR